MRRTCDSYAATSCGSSVYLRDSQGWPATRRSQIGGGPDQTVVGRELRSYEKVLSRFPIKWGANELLRVSQPYDSFQNAILIDFDYFCLLTLLSLRDCSLVSLSFRTLASARRQPPQRRPQSLANASLLLQCRTTLPTFRVNQQCTVKTRRAQVGGSKLQTKLVQGQYLYSTTNDFYKEIISLVGSSS